MRRSQTCSYNETGPYVTPESWKQNPDAVRERIDKTFRESHKARKGGPAAIREAYLKANPPKSPSMTAGTGSRPES